ncbi:MAG TPA: hypothetical protein VGY58_11670 [Gemmataceae bacterium]|jgi:hypothetical protein|nr:hypothetical protein [Gemmataceae bacterium]
MSEIVILLVALRQQFVIASEAKQSRRLRNCLDCFVAPLLAMTSQYQACDMPQPRERIFDQRNAKPLD